MRGGMRCGMELGGRMPAGMTVVGMPLAGMEGTEGTSISDPPL